MSHYLPDEAAYAAASDAACAIVELIRYGREGDYSKRPRFADDVATKLAGALLLTIEIDSEPFEPDAGHPPHWIAMRDAIRAYLQAEGHEV